MVLGDFMNKNQGGEAVENIAVLQERIVDALARVTRGLSRLSQTSMSDITESMSEITGGDTLAFLKREVATLNKALTDLRLQNTQLRQGLAAQKTALKSSGAEGQDPEAGQSAQLEENKTLQEELTALRAARKADRAELEDIIDTLQPLVYANLPPGHAQS